MEVIVMGPLQQRRLVMIADTLVFHRMVMGEAAPTATKRVTSFIKEEFPFYCKLVQDTEQFDKYMAKMVDLFNVSMAVLKG